MLSYNCPKIPSPKKIKEGIKNFLKIYPQYTNYYNNLYDSKNLAGGSSFQVIFWPKCHTIKVYSNCSENITDGMCEYFKEWIEGTSLKLEIVKDKSKADLKIKVGGTGKSYLASTSSVGILNLEDLKYTDGFNFFINMNKNYFYEDVIGIEDDDNFFTNPTLVKATLLHEFGHFLGFNHEHTRSDRPFNFNIKKLEKDVKNPKIAETLNFFGNYNLIREQILQSNDYKDKSASYDFKSIMQYDLLKIKNYITCNKGVNCEDLFKLNTSLSQLDKSFCKNIYGSGKNCPEPPSPPLIGPKKCEELQKELEKYDKAIVSLTEIIFDKRAKLAIYEKIDYDKFNIPEDRAKNEKLVETQKRNLVKLELERFDYKYLTKKLKSRMEEGKCVIETTTEKPKTRTENCEFLLNLEKKIKSLLSCATDLKEKMNFILKTDIDKQKLKLADEFINIYENRTIHTYLDIASAIKKLNELTSYKLKKQKEVLIKEVKNKTKGFSSVVEPVIENVFKDLQVAFNNKNINFINKTLKSLVLMFEFSIKELTSLMPIISLLKIEFCTTTTTTTTTTPRPTTTPQSTSTPRPVFISKS